LKLELRTLCVIGARLTLFSYIETIKFMFTCADVAAGFDSIELIQDDVPLLALCEEDKEEHLQTSRQVHRILVSVFITLRNLILKPLNDSRTYRPLHFLPPFAVKHLFVASSNFIINMDSSFTCLERHRLYSRRISQTPNRKYVSLRQ
jgi:hypothetical protein